MTYPLSKIRILLFLSASQNPTHQTPTNLPLVTRQENAKNQAFFSKSRLGHPLTVLLLSSYHPLTTLKSAFCPFDHPICFLIFMGLTKNSQLPPWAVKFFSRRFISNTYPEIRAASRHRFPDNLKPSINAYPR